MCVLRKTPEKEDWVACEKTKQTQIKHTAQKHKDGGNFKKRETLEEKLNIFALSLKNSHVSSEKWLANW